MIKRVLSIGALAGALAACGGGSSTSSSTSSSHSPPQPASAIRGKLVGANHAPKVNVNWPYTVTVTDADGHPLNGTVTIQFTFAGQVVGRDTPPTHPLRNGRWHDNLKFPPQSLGQPISLQAVVRTPRGSITLDWPVKTTR